MLVKSAPMRGDIVIVDAMLLISHASYSLLGFPIDNRYITR